MRLLVVFLLIPYIGFTQLHHQMISSQGNTSKTDNLIVTQTIGQQSIIGNSNVGSFHYNQGFQQPFWNRLIQSNQPEFLADYFPNPFIDKITFRFLNLDNEEFNITLFDTAGRLVYQTKENLTENTIVLNLTDLPSGSYLVRLFNTKKTFYTKIIKK